MICHEKELIFIHGIKTGGYTIKSILSHYSDDLLLEKPNKFGKDGLIMVDASELRKKEEGSGKPLSHKDLLSLGKMHFDVKHYQNSYPDVFDHFHKFTIIRNPWDRIMSYLLWLNKGVYNAKAFKQWLKYKGIGIFSDKKELNQLSLLIDNSHGNVTDENLMNINLNLNQIINYENFKTELKLLFHDRKINYGNNLDTKLNSVNKEKHYSLYYDDELKELVDQECSWDINYFNFKFEDKR